MIGGIVEFQGQLDFYSNNAVGFDGGAIYLLSYSQMLLHNDTHLEFVNNTGRSAFLKWRFYMHRNILNLRMLIQ